MELNKETASMFIDALEKQGRFKDFLGGLAKTGQNDFLRAIGEVVGAERFQQLLGDSDKGADYGDPIAAAVKQKNVEAVRMLIEARGAVPHKISPMSPIHEPFHAKPVRSYSYAAPKPKEPSVPTLVCKALDEALGIPYGAISADQAKAPFEPDVRLVKMVLDAMPDVHPETFFFHAVSVPWTFGLGGQVQRSASLMSLALISGNDDLVQLMLDRDPNFSEIDLMYAIHMGKSDVAARIVERMGSYPARALHILGSLDAAGQRKVVRALATADKGEGKFDMPSDLSRFVPESVMLIHEKADVPMGALLMRAASNGNADVVSELLKAGADPKRLQVWGSADSDKCTPLHEARGARVVELLLEAGADPNATTFNGVPVIISWLQRGTGNGWGTSNAELPLMITKLAQAGADMGIKYGGRSLQQLAGKWPDDVRRAIRAAKTGELLDSAFSGDDAPSGPSSSSGGMSPL